MKKILLIAAFFVSTGIISSCTKENGVTPTTTTTKVADEYDEAGNHLGTGDGGVDRPVVKKP